MTDSRKPTFYGLVCRGCYALGTACGHCERCAVDPLNPANAKPAPIPAQPSPEQERDVDELLEDFQRACERCVSHLASDEGYARTDAKNRAILRNELRSRLLSVVSPPADKILGYRVEVDPKMPPNEIRLVGTDGQSITYVLPPADTGKET